ncbi:MAG: lipopolysaccharide biosynthesis protein [Woeseiaceae bacterium]|nr:lipopolysaccharide biosynthesis protein [Woeseiaceae bacterium]
MIRDKVLTAIRWTAIARFSGQMFTWVVTIFVIRILSPADYGMMAMAMVLTSLLFLINNIGLDSVLIQRPNLDERMRAQIFGTVIVTNVLCFLLMILAAEPLARFFNEPELTILIQVLAIQFLILVFEALPLSAMERELDFKKRSIVEFVTMLATSLITLALALAGTGVWALVIGHLAAQASRILGFNLITRCLCRPRFSLRGMKDVFSFGGFVSVDKILWFVFAESDKFVGGKMLGKDLLGFYSVANHLASLPINKIAGLITSVAFPAFSKIHLDLQAVRSYLLKAVRMMSLFAFPVFFGMSSVAHSAVVLFLGDKWLGAIVPLQILAIVMPVRMISTVVPPVLWGIGQPRTSAGNFFIASIIMVPAFVIGAGYGPVGLAMAWALAYPVVFFIKMLRTTNSVDMSIWTLLGGMLRPALASAGMYAAVVVAKPYVVGEAGQVLYLLQLVGVGAIAYAGLVYLIYRDGLKEALALFQRGGTNDGA